MRLSLNIPGVEHFKGHNTNPKLALFEQFPRGNSYPSRHVQIFLTYIEQIPVFILYTEQPSPHPPFTVLTLNFDMVMAIMFSLNLSFFRVNIPSSFTDSFPLLRILVALPSQIGNNWDSWWLFYSVQLRLRTCSLLCCYISQLKWAQE